MRRLRQWLKEYVHNAIVHPLMPFLPKAWGDEMHDRNARWAFGEDFDPNPPKAHDPPREAFWEACERWTPPDAHVYMCEEPLDLGVSTVVTDMGTEIKIPKRYPSDVDVYLFVIDRRNEESPSGRYTYAFVPEPEEEEVSTAHNVEYPPNRSYYDPTRIW